MGKEHTLWAGGFQGYSRVSYEESQTLPFQMHFKKIGFPKICADWCEKNTVGAWGWYFKGGKVGMPIEVYMGFEHQMDMFMFQLCWAERFDRGEEWQER